jgi:hypothetical protein
LCGRISAKRWDCCPAAEYSYFKAHLRRASIADA